MLPLYLHRNSCNLVNMWRIKSRQQAEGDEIEDLSIFILKVPTEAGLLSAMENAGRFIDDDELKEHLKERGLGTPSTRAGIIERLIAVGYLSREGKKLVPTRKGIGLIDVVVPELKSPEMTGEWEQKLGDIKKGLLTSAEFMADIKKYTAHVVGEARKADIGKMQVWENEGEEIDTDS